MGISVRYILGFSVIWTLLFSNKKLVFQIYKPCLSWLFRPLSDINRQAHKSLSCVGEGAGLILHEGGGVVSPRPNRKRFSGERERKKKRSNRVEKNSISCFHFKATCWAQNLDTHTWLMTLFKEDYWLFFASTSLKRWCVNGKDDAGAQLWFLNWILLQVSRSPSVWSKNEAARPQHSTWISTPRIFKAFATFVDKKLSCVT